MMNGTREASRQGADLSTKNQRSKHVLGDLSSELNIRPLKRTKQDTVKIKNPVAVARQAIKEKQAVKDKRTRKTGQVKDGNTSRLSQGTRTKYDHIKSKIDTNRRESHASNESCRRLSHTNESAERDDSGISLDSKSNSILKVSDRKDKRSCRTDDDLLSVAISGPNQCYKSINITRASRSKASSNFNNLNKDATTSIPHQRILEPQGITADRTLARQRTGTTTATLVKEIVSKRETKFPQCIKSLFRPRIEVQKRKCHNLTEQYYDPLMLIEYELDIYTYLREIEIVTTADPKYIERQPDLDWGMRNTLVGWIIQLHVQFKLLPETLYLTINLIDRTLSLKAISVSKLQLVGITALLIASKYEEILSPCMSDLVYISDNTYDGDEIVRAERHMLGIIKYQIGYTNPLNFLKRLTAHGVDPRIILLSNYFLESMLLGYQFIQYLPSKVAAASFFLAIKVIEDGYWTALHVQLIGYTESDLLECVYAILAYLKSKDNQIVYDKFADIKFGNISRNMQMFMRQKGMI